MGSKKTTTTKTPTIPDWIQQPTQDLFGQVSDLAGQDPRSFVADPNASLTLADQKAQGLGTDYNSLFGEAASGVRDLLAGGPAAASAAQLGDVSKYFNPFQQDVVNSTVDQLQRAGDRTIKGAQLAYAGPNLGNNASVTEALTRGEVQNGINDAVSNLNLNGWNSAAGLADSQAGRDQQASLLNAQLAAQDNAQKLAAVGQLGQLGALFGDSQRADIGTLAGTGGTLQGIEQAQAGAPLDVASQLGSIYGGLTNPYVGETTKSKTSGGALGAIGSGLLGIGSLFAAPITGGASLGGLTGLGGLFGAKTLGGIGGGAASKAMAGLF